MPGSRANKQKFIEDPFAQNPAQRLYRTGDLVRRDETGLWHFLCRMDNQIKVNGCRIEPEHVEIVLRRHLPLKDIAVVACSLANGAKHLVAFVVPLSGKPIGTGASALKSRGAVKQVVKVVFSVGP